MIPNTQPSLVELVQTMIDRSLTETHTCLPGIVESFDEATQLAKVNPAIKRLARASGSVAIPPILDVPVVFPSAGGYSITFPVSAGDEVLLVFSERAIDNWLSQGGVHDPYAVRKHDYTDAFAIIGIHSNSRAISSYATDGLEIRNDAGTTKIKLTSTAVTIDISTLGGATFNADGSVVFKNGASITAGGNFVSGTGITLNTHVHGSSGPPTG